MAPIREPQADNFKEDRINKDRSIEDSELLTDELVEILRRQVKPALGCTEPIAAALAVARAREELGCGSSELKLKRIEITVSPNIYKNGFHVAIPGTDKKGIAFAAALAFLTGESALGLEVLRNAREEDCRNAGELLELIDLGYRESGSKVYVRARLETGRGSAEVIIKDRHDNIVSVKVNGEVRFQQRVLVKGNGGSKLSVLSLKTLIRLIENIAEEKLAFLLDGVEMNREIALAGLKERPGLGVGAGIQELINQGVLANDLPNQSRMMAAAASDARMGGIKMPVMSSAGSGNQGITAILPVAVTAWYYDKPRETLVRALAISHLLTAYIKEYTGSLAPICGCSVAAGVGAVAGITWMLGGSFRQITGAVNNIIANLSGMICDGAKDSCALKIATSAHEAVTSAHLAVNDTFLSRPSGIIQLEAEKSIQNLGQVCVKGMREMDRVILELLDPGKAPRC